MIINIEDTFGPYFSLLDSLSGSRAEGLRSTVAFSRQRLGDIADLSSLRNQTELRLLVNDLHETVIAGLADAGPEQALVLFGMMRDLENLPEARMVRERRFLRT